METLFQLITRLFFRHRCPKEILILFACLISVFHFCLNFQIPCFGFSFDSISFLQIGQGTYSSVYKARDLINKKVVALKRVRFDNKDPESVKFMAREILILRRLEHPNIIKLESLVTSRASCSLYLAFEYMEHDLTGLASLPGVKFSEQQVLNSIAFSI